MTQISISIAAYNDEPTIGPLIDESIQILSQVTQDYEIFVIDDGSRDATLSVTQQKARLYPQVHIHEHKQNLGFGTTIKEIYTLPSGKWIFFIPGDGQIPPAELLKLYPHREQFEFILGYRRHRNDHWFRKFNSRCYNLLVSWLAGFRIHDVNSVGLLKKHILSGVEFKSTSAFIHAEILLAVHQRNGRIREIDIDHNSRNYGRASGARIKIIFNTFLDMVKYICYGL